MDNNIGYGHPTQTELLSGSKPISRGCNTCGCEPGAIAISAEARWTLVGLCEGATSRFYEFLAATAEALADRSSACPRQDPPRTAPSAASRRRPRAPLCPAPARPPPSRPIVAFSLGLGALKRGSRDDLTKTSTLHTGLSLSLLQREFRWFGWQCASPRLLFFEMQQGPPLGDR